MNKTTISLGNKLYFELFIGERVLKEQIFNSKGEIPVFSANVFTPFGYIDKSNIHDFKSDYILWGIDGDFKFNIIRDGNIFATTDHCGAIKILDKRIIPEYLLIQLELQSQILNYDRTLRPSLSLMKRININIPIDSNGFFDVAIQNSVMEKYKLLEDCKESIRTQINELSKVTFDIKPPDDNFTLTISNIFDLEQTTNKSYFTKEFVNKNKGSIPVYSASKNPNIISYGLDRKSTRLNSSH
jgi:hypothetical protein